MDEREKTILQLMYDLQVELHTHQTEQIVGLHQAVQGNTRAIASLQRSHEILGKLLKATGELIGVH